MELVKNIHFLPSYVPKLTSLFHNSILSFLESSDRLLHYPSPPFPLPSSVPHKEKIRRYIPLPFLSPSVKVHFYIYLFLPLLITVMIRTNTILQSERDIGPPQRAVSTKLPNVKPSINPRRRGRMTNLPRVLSRFQKMRRWTLKNSWQMLASLTPRNSRR